MKTIRDIMTPHVISVDPDDRVEDVIGLMLRHHISGVPVIDMADRLLGVITEYDLLGIIDDLATERNKVYHYMIRDVVTIEAELSLSKAVEAFRSRSIRRFPVVSEGKVIGIVSRRELIRYVREERIANSSTATSEELVEENA